MFADRVVSPHDIDPAGRNALVHASKHKSTELAVFLLDQSADFSQPNSLRGTASERFLQGSFGGMYSDSDAIIRRILKVTILSSILVSRHSTTLSSALISESFRLSSMQLQTLSIFQTL